MKWSVYIVSLVVVLISSCKAQDKEQDRSKADVEKEITANTEDGINAPKVNIHVNREYDEDGNQIGFDSTYTSYYSTVEGDTSLMDSLFHEFDPFYRNNYLRFFDEHFGNLFFNDSLFYHDFFHEDFFQKRFEINSSYFNEMMKEMDSLKNEFYEKNKGKWNKER